MMKDIEGMGLTYCRHGEAGLEDGEWIVVVGRCWGDLATMEWIT